MIDGKRKAIHAVALVIRSLEDKNKVLLVLRPQDDKELPGIWGLPATTCQSMESEDMAARRIGPQKLSRALRFGCKLASDNQVYTDHALEMTLYEASLEDTTPGLIKEISGISNITLYIKWQWNVLAMFKTSANQGSLCSRIILRSFSLK